MSLQAFGNAQLPLVPHSSAFSAAIPSILPFVESSAPREDATEETVTIPTSDTSVLEQEEKCISGSESDFAPVDLSVVEKLTLRVSLWLDKISAAIYGDARTLASKETYHRPRKDSLRVLDRGHTRGRRCSWFWVCDTTKPQNRPSQASLSEDKSADDDEIDDDDEAYLYDTGYDYKGGPEDWKHDNRTMNEIPQYVLDYAPLVYLFSGEQFWPCDIADHLNHVTPNLNYTPILSRTNNLNLTNLDTLNEYDDGRFVYLKSDDNVEERPDWLGGQKNIPNQPDEQLQSPHPHRRKPSDPRDQQPPIGGRSSAPAVLVTVNKGHGIVDAFWFYFYSYNLGNKVLNIRFGNHIGDWEHSLIRFQHGEPKIVFFSEHFFGQAYTYAAVEKIGRRPVVYSAVGTHANYATSGLHPYILPLGLLHDETDKGPLWDPAMNCMKYTYDVRNDSLTPEFKDAPTEWFFFNGHWGDKLYPLDDRRQYEFAGQYHYVTGPLGPRFKHLGRRKVCQGPYKNECEVRKWLEAEGEGEIPVYPGPGDGEGEGEVAGGGGGMGEGRWN
ncbi:MAG: hypothetical protein Q9195_002456 [Heterodermia aff. obscurata]